MTAYTSPATHVRVAGVFGNTAAAPVEEWSFGFHYGVGFLPAGLDARLPDVWAAASAYIGGTQGNGFAAFGSDTWLTEVQAATLAPTGGLADGYYSRYSGTPVCGAGAVANSAPLQISYAVSLDAGKPAAGRFGRFYPPKQVGSMTLGRSSDQDAADRLAHALTMLRAIGNVLGAHNDAGPFNGASTTPAPLVVVGPTHSTIRNVRDVKVGTVPDTQRRRRNSLVEAYTSSSY